MNELKLISNTTPAQVTFNYDEINANLDEVLKKYSGLVFTDETVVECKKTITELKKGQKSLNAFKIKTKKELTEDITKFEAQCKLLSNKFDTVINPISNQADEFEVVRKEKKRTEIEALIEKLGEELEDKYYEQLVITDSMLNKGTKMKDITQDLTKQADLLLAEQNMEKANIELIKSKVELANSQYGVTLPESMYLRMLEYSTVTEITKSINDDAEKTKIAAEEAEAEKLAIEARKVERLAKMEADRIALETQREAERVANETRKAERERLAEIEKAKVVVVEPMVEIIPPIEFHTPNPHEDIEAEVFIENYKVEGTEAELNTLESFLNANNYDWSIKAGE